MTAWTNDELSRAGDAEELQIASARRDGTLGSPEEHHRLDHQPGRPVHHDPARAPVEPT